MIFGLDLTHKRADIYRALLEGVAYGVNDIFKTYHEAGAPLERIAAVGGGTRNTVWSQAISDVSEKLQLVRSKTIGAAYGNCFLAAVAVGIWLRPISKNGTRWKDVSCLMRRRRVFISMASTRSKTLRADGRSDADRARLRKTGLLRARTRIGESRRSFAKT